MPTDAVITCDPANPCPAPLLCVEGLGRCASTGAPCLDPQGDRLVPVADGNTCDRPDGAGFCRAGACVASTCGDGILDSRTGEVCDAGADNTDAWAAAQRCNARCSGFAPYCGDQVKNGDEVCDADDLDGEACQDQGYYRGTLLCAATCDRFNLAACAGTCGDDVKDPEEACDGTDLDDRSCLTQGYYTGALACAATCDHLDLSGCAGFCGDDVKNGDELCDGPDVGPSLACADFDFDSGVLGCDAGCDHIDTGSCLGFCGDGVKDADEECDGLDQGGDSCVNVVDIPAGALGCDARCRRTTELCPDQTNWHFDDWGGGRALLDISGTAADDVWIAGTGIVLHFDGREWRGTGLEAGGSIAAPSRDRVLIAGRGDEGMGAFGWLKDCTAAACGAARGFAEPVVAVWGADATHAFAVGASGQVAHSVSGVWTSSLFGPPFNSLNDVWGRSTTDVYAVGYNRTVLRFNGTTWSPEMANVAGQHLYGVWVAPGGDVFAVGAPAPTDPLILHYSAGSWNPEAPPPGLGGALRAVWGTSAVNVYAVGNAGSIIYSDGGSWEPLASPTSAILRGIWGSSDTDIWAVGEDPSSSRHAVIIHSDGGPFTLVSGPGEQLRDVHGTSDTFAVAVGGKAVRRYDGITWSYTEITSPASVTLNGVWMASEEVGVAVGSSATGAALEHFNGTTWSPKAAPGGVGPLVDVWGTGVADIVAVGGSAVIRWNGSSWQNVVPSAPSTSLLSVWTYPPDYIFAGDSSGQVHRYHAGGWTTDVLPIPGGPSAIGPVSIGSLGGRSETDAFAAGGGDDGSSVGFVAAYHFDGAAWTPILETGYDPYLETGYLLVTPAEPGETFALEHRGLLQRYAAGTWSPLASVPAWDSMLGVWAPSGHELFAVGSFGQIAHLEPVTWTPAAGAATTADLRAVTALLADGLLAVGMGGAAVTYDLANGWASVDTGVGADLLSAWGGGSGDVIVVGTAGTILSFDGAGFLPLVANVGADLHAVWGSAPDDVWAAGAGGTLLHLTADGLWHPIPVATSTTLRALWGAGASFVLAAGDGGELWRFDGGGWQAVPTATTAALRAIAGVGPEHAFVVGDAGTLLHVDGAHVHSVPSPTVATLRGVACRRGDDCFVAGDAGTALHFDGTSFTHMEAATTGIVYGLGRGSGSEVWAVGGAGLRSVYAVALPTPYGGACAEPIAAYCGGRSFGSTRLGSNRFSTYPCAAGLGDLDGREVRYRLEVPHSGRVEVVVTPAGEDLAVIVAGALPSGGCDPLTRCATAKLAPDSVATSTTFDTTAGATHFVIIDSAAPVDVGFTVDITCPRP